MDVTATIGGAAVDVTAAIGGSAAADGTAAIAGESENWKNRPIFSSFQNSQMKGAAEIGAAGGEDALPAVVWWRGRAVSGSEAAISVVGLLLTEPSAAAAAEAWHWAYNYTN